jgi:hypothetical protein
MNNKLPFNLRTGFLVLAAVLSVGALTLPLRAQNPEMQERVAEMKMAAAMNKQALAQMTWVETVTISLKGEQKKVEHFQVRLGPDGKPQKTSLDQPAAPPEQSGRRGRLKEHIVEKKKEEYTDYANQMKALAQQYLPPDKDLLQQSYANGGVTFAPSDAPGTLQITFRNYVKPQDSMTMVVDKASKRVVQVQIASYMSNQKDAMTLLVDFAQVSDGSNQISRVVMNGVSKQLTIAVQDSSYQHL